jgi:hypothetical protein
MEASQGHRRDRAASEALLSRVLKLALFALVFAAALMLGAHNARADSRSLELGTPISLEAAISTLADRPITITVDTELPGSWGGGAWAGAPYIYIGRDAYNDAQIGGGHGLLVLLHELGHTTGIKNEAAANCFALNHLQSFLRANWDTQQFDGWAYRFDPVATRYQEAIGHMRAQSPIYQCERA